MARVICPKCLTEFNVCNHDKMTVEAFHDNTNNIIGTLVPAGENKMEMTKVEALKAAGFSEEEINKMIGIVGFNKNEVIKSDEISSIVLGNRAAKNSVSFRRWITSQFLAGHFKNNGGVHEYISKKDYNWQFEMMLNEIDTLIKMKQNGDEEFFIRSKFFTIYTVKSIMISYRTDLKIFLEERAKYQNKKCKGVPYVKYSALRKKNLYKNCCFVSDIYAKIISPLDVYLININSSSTYEELYKNIKRFIISTDFIKLPYSYKKIDLWVDTFKAEGAYYSMMNLSQYSDLKIRSYVTGKVLTKTEARKYLNGLVGKTKGYELYGQFKQMLKDNNYEYQDFVARCIETRRERLNKKNM